MRVLICGAGIAGLTLALALERKGHRPFIVERASGPREEGYMIDFFGSGWDACAELHLLEDLQTIHYPIERFAFVDGEGHERMSLSYPLLRQRLFDGHHFNFLRGDLERILLSKIAGRVRIRHETSISTIAQRQDGVSVRFTDGSIEEVDIVVGADGVHSRVRDLVFRPGEECERFVGCYATAFAWTGALPGIARDAFYTLTVPGRQVAIYPIRNDRFAAFLLHRAPRHTPESIEKELRSAFSDIGWIVPSLLDRAFDSKSIYFDAVTQIELPEWHRRRVVLLGDACWCVSLLAGQGASMAMAGALILAEELDRFRNEPGKAFAIYEEKLKPAIGKQQAAGRRVADWFLPESQFRIGLRDLGLRASLIPGASWFLRRRLAADSVFR